MLQGSLASRFEASKVWGFTKIPRYINWWRVKDLNLRRQSRGIYSPLPLAARATRQGRTSVAAIMDSAKGKDTLAP